MNPQIKALGIARLKAGEPIETIAEELDISPALVQEWYDSFTPEDRVSQELNLLALDKATDILATTTEKNSEELKTKLMTLALAVSGQLQTGLHDHEIAKALNLSADTIQKLYSTFFSDKAQVAFINNNYTGDTLTTFKDALSD